MASGSNLQELTVTCRQCGSASMERLGPREYRCSHCGAITVVSQEQQDFFEKAFTAAQHAAAPAGSGPAPTPHEGARAAPAATAAGKGIGVLRFLVFLLLAGALIVGIGESLGHKGSSSSSPAAGGAIAVDAKLVTLSQVAWLADPSSDHRSRYVGIVANHSPFPVRVPQYRMTLYADGIRRATAESSAPLPRLMPGEYEPVAFTFDRSSGDTRSEIEAPDTVEQASEEAVPLTLTSQQLVHEEGQQQYRLVGLLKNASTPVASAQVLVMLFGANHTLMGYGTASIQKLRHGEQAAVDVQIPTSSVNPVQSYEYLVDTTAKDE